MESETISSKKEDKETKNEPVAEKEEYDIESALKLTDHFMNTYPNGLTLGVRMEAVPGTPLMPMNPMTVRSPGRCQTILHQPPVSR